MSLLGVHNIKLRWTEMSFHPLKSSQFPERPPSVLLQWELPRCWGAPHCLLTRSPLGHSFCSTWNPLPHLVAWPVSRLRLSLEDALSVITQVFSGCPVTGQQLWLRLPGQPGSRHRQEATPTALLGAVVFLQLLFWGSSLRQPLGLPLLNYVIPHVIVEHSVIGWLLFRLIKHLPFLKRGHFVTSPPVLSLSHSMGFFSVFQPLSFCGAWQLCSRTCEFKPPSASTISSLILLNPEPV